MAVVIVLVVLAALVLPFIGGFITQSNRTPQGTPMGAPSDSSDCSVLCAEWDQRRQERCLAEATAAAAQRTVGNLRTELAVATGVALVLAASAAAATLIPVIGYVVAAVLAVAAAAALIAAEFILGELAAAGTALEQAEGRAANARQAEAEARTRLVQTCGDKATACLSRPGPC